MDLPAIGPIGLIAANPAPAGTKAGAFGAVLGAMNFTDTQVATNGSPAVEAAQVGANAGTAALPAMPGANLTVPSLFAAQLPAGDAKTSLLASAAAVGAISPDALVAETGVGSTVSVPATAEMADKVEGDRTGMKGGKAKEGTLGKIGEGLQTNTAPQPASLLLVQPQAGEPPAGLPETPVDLVVEATSQPVEQSRQSAENVQAEVLVTQAASPSHTVPPAQTALLTQPQAPAMEQPAGEQQGVAITAKQPGEPVPEATTGSASAGGRAEAGAQPFAQLARSAAAEQSQPNAAGLAGVTNSALPQGQLGSQPRIAADVPAQPQPVMQFRDDKIAREMGLEIARRVSAGGEELVIRLDPGELGRINIRMAVNEHGQLRAIVAADAPAVLEALRSDIGELNRALEQAGVRTDGQSFRFDRGGSGDSGGQWQQRYQQQASTRHGETGDLPASEDSPAYRPMATNGRVNMMA